MRTISWIITVEVTSADNRVTVVRFNYPGPKPKVSF
jgi:hypothetical protein